MGKKRQTTLIKIYKPDSSFPKAGGIRIYCKHGE
jgi:hypothetical protein